MSSAVRCNWCGTFAENQEGTDLPDGWRSVQHWHRSAEECAARADGKWIAQDWCGKCDPCQTIFCLVPLHSTARGAPKFFATERQYEAYLSHNSDRLCAVGDGL